MRRLRRLSVNARRRLGKTVDLIELFRRPKLLASFCAKEMKRSTQIDRETSPVKEIRRFYFLMPDRIGSGSALLAARFESELKAALAKGRAQ